MVMGFQIINNELYVCGCFLQYMVCLEIYSQMGRQQWSQVGTTLPNIVVGMEVYCGRLYKNNSFMLCSR